MRQSFSVVSRQSSLQKIATFSLATSILALGACSSEGGSSDRLVPPGGLPRAAAGSGSIPSGAGGFSSDSPAMLAEVMQQQGGSQSFDPTPCEVGKFCGPQGPDPNHCGTLRLEQDIEITRNPGNVLIVFDQSVSMSEPWGTTGRTKLQAAQEAVTTAVKSLQDLLTVGAIFFPTTTCMPSRGAGLGGLPGGGLPGGLGGLGGMSVNPIDGPGQIPFQPAAQFITAWDAHWGQLGAALNIGTPMQEAFDRADAAIQSSKLPGQLVVVAFTDGQPNCFPAGGSMTDTEPNRAATWLMSKGIKTYVVGLPGAQGVQILNNVAMSGGTTEYIIPDDPAALEMKLKEVVNQTIKMGFDTCSINLKPAADPADKLQMVVEEKGMRSKVDHNLSKDAGWTITPDGTHVEITGRLCDDAKAGRFESITFEYGCKDLPELPPPAGPM